MSTRLVIAGLDGATWHVLEPLIQAGNLPTLARLCEQGMRGYLTSVWPPISAAAWVSMLTGSNPGQHGVYDFRNLDLSRYSAHDEQLASSASYQLPTLFDYVSGVIAYQTPLTYPPWPIQGVMVAGYPTPDYRRAFAEPPAWGERLSPLDAYTADQVGRLGPEAQAALYRRSMTTMTDNLIRLSREVEWQLLMFVNGATDGAQHRFFKFVQPGFPGISVAAQRRRAYLLTEVMIAADAELGRLLAHLPPDVNVLVISDHGGRPRPWRAFHLNAWLAQRGWLQPRANAAGSQKQTALEWAKQRLPMTEWAKQRLPATIKDRISRVRASVDQIDWSRTQAYRVKLSHPIEGVHLNVIGRQPQGIVPITDYSSLREKIMAALRQQPEIQEALPREEVFSGPFLNRAPDILIQLHPDFDGGNGLQELVTDIPASWLQSISGYHDLKGILVAAGPAFAAGAVHGAQLIDITPTALHTLGLPVPRHMDGRVLPLFAERRPVTYIAGEEPTTAADEPPLSAAEVAGMMAALRDLGYVE